MGHSNTHAFVGIWGYRALAAAVVNQAFIDLRTGSQERANDAFNFLLMDGAFYQEALGLSTDIPLKAMEIYGQRTRRDKRVWVVQS